MINDFYIGNTVRIPIKFSLVIDLIKTPIDITGSTVYFTMKLKLTDAYEDAVIKKVVTTHTDPANGESEIVLLPDDTKIEAREYHWDITIKHDEEQIYTIRSGKVKALQGTTDVV